MRPVFAIYNSLGIVKKVPQARIGVRNQNDSYGKFVNFGSLIKG